MAITVADLKFFQSERMTDEDDGGGMMTATEIVSGADNQIFDDISDVDRAAGDVSIRKVYAAVTSADTAKYLDAGVAVFAEPADPATSVLAFSTASWNDERADLQDRIEQCVTRAGRYHGYLYGVHVAGQRALILWQRPDAPPPAVGRYQLVAKAGSTEGDSQFVLVTRVSTEERTVYEAYSGETITYQVLVVTAELAEALRYPFDGNEPSRGEPSYASLDAVVYETRYQANTVPFYSIAPTTALAETGDFAVVVDSLYRPLIPTLWTETPLADITPAGDWPTLVSSNEDPVTFYTAAEVIKPSVGFYLGNSVLPSTLTLTVSGATITDDNAELLLGGSTVIGSIDYGNGICTWNAACPNYGAGNKTVVFQPAARTTRFADSYDVAVTAENLGYVWVTTLAPVPAPQTLRIAYRANGVWYVLNDVGNGQMRGVDSSYGSGVLNLWGAGAGTVTITTGALPDVGSAILYTWGAGIDYFPRGGSVVDAPVIRGTAEDEDLTPGTVSVEWTVGGTTYTLDDAPAADGALTGTGGVGAVSYDTGEWWVRPTTIPAVGTVFTLSYTFDAALKTFTEPHPVPGGDGHTLTLQLPDTDILPNTVYVRWVNYYGGGEATPRTEVDTAFYAATSRKDNGAGGLVGGGTITYATGEIVFDCRFTGTTRRRTYGWQSGRWGVDSIALVSVTVNEPQSVTVRYRTASDASTGEQEVTLSTLNLDLTRGNGETITRGSVRFRIGTDVYVDTAGQIYRNPSLETGSGTLAGTLDPSTGRVTLSSWTAGVTNAIALDALTTEIGSYPVGHVAFRTQASPLKAGTLQLRYTELDGTAQSKTVNSSGLLEDSDALIQVDHDHGVVRARFGLWKVDANLTPQEKLEPWYDPDERVMVDGVLSIWKPTLVLADSILYNAVARSAQPPDSALLGLDAARMPPDGNVLQFEAGRLALVHHTDTHAENSLSPTQQVDMGRVRLYRVVIDDVNEQRLPASFYSVNRETGIVTLAADLNLTGYTGPYTFRHTVADLVRLTRVDINGTLTLNKALSHDYPADDSRVSAVLYIGTLQARYSALFAQSAWTSVWSDTRIGDAPLADYNDATYPIQVSNAGTYTDRILLKFTSATAFQCFAENGGLLGTGSTTVNFAPTNALTGQTYFTLDYRGWGGGWATGNCLRFNLVGACYPVDLIRAIQPSDPSGADDAVELLFLGNVDA